jgi:predicted nuclease of predicted toxin-antitoxin system
VKLLFDHNVPHKLRHSLPGHAIQTADEMGWATLENGQLLQAAREAHLEILVTCDQNLSYQQNLQDRRLSLVVLSTNNWNALKQDLQPVVAAIDAASQGRFSSWPFSIGIRHPTTQTRRKIPSRGGLLKSICLA